MKSVLRNVCKTVWRSDSLPENWSKSTLVQLYKGSGATNELRNYRFIHKKSDFSKLFGHLVMNKAKVEFMANMSKFQIFKKPRHRAQEHILTLKCVISFYLRYDQPLILSTWDQGGLKYTLPGTDGGGGGYLIGGLGHEISCQTRNTISSLLKVKVARTRT